jgi:xanthine dehydrogenase accessory factor
VTCLDSRSQWLDKIGDDQRLTKICTEDLTEFAASLTNSDYVICMTMGHSTDRPILSTIFRKQIAPAYLGVIGSKSKRGALVRELKEDGISPDAAEQFLCPIGLPIGSNQPAEIAISIAAQLIEHRDSLKNG